MTSAPTIAAFQATPDEYDSRNRPWLFSTPRHHAAATSMPAAGNRIRTRRIARARRAPVKPGAIASMRIGVASTPASTSTDITSISSAKIVRATCAASRSRPCARSPAWTGMKEPDSAPSPKRFCSRLGIRSAAVNASASACRPKKYENIIVRTSPARRLARMPAATIASAVAKRRRAAGGLSGTRGGRRARNRLVGVGGLPGKPGQNDRVLLQVLLADALVHVDVRVVHADVVVLVLLDRIEARDARAEEAEVIRVADAGNHVPPRAEILPRPQPPIH